VNNPRVKLLYRKRSSLLKKSPRDLSAVSNRTENAQKRRALQPKGGQKESMKVFFNTLARF
jgi:hypothetical protein